MSSRGRVYHRLKLWVIYHLDKFVTWTPLVQIPVIILATATIVSGWAIVLWLTSTQPGTDDSFWWALSRFADGGTMAGDRGGGVRLVAVGVTASGILLLAFLTGAFASKLSERIDDLRTGRSPVVEKGHVLILGFDGKVPFVARELARSHQKLTLVTLAEEDKARQEAVLRIATRVARSRVRVVVRTGDPRSEIALLRVAADRAQSIVVMAHPRLSDDQAILWTLSTLLALRRVTGASYGGRIVVDARRSMHEPLLMLTAEAGLAGRSSLPIDIVATDDVIARVLAQSVRHGAVYLALRELLSFRGNEFHLEPVPRELLGRSFEEAHRRVERAVAVGVLRSDGRHLLAPDGPSDVRLDASDRLILLERECGDFSVGTPLPDAAPESADARGGFHFPRTVAVLGYNRCLAVLVVELDRVMHAGSHLRLSHPVLPAQEEEEIDRAARECQHVSVERFNRAPHEIGREGDPALEQAEGVVILGCEDEHDPNGDASAAGLLLQIRRRERAGGQRLERIVTEVRDPTTANQIASTLHDFLVSTDVVAMMLAQVAVNPDLTRIYREILDPGGAEIFIRPLDYCASSSCPTFAGAMAGARARGEIAIGYVAPRDTPRPMPRRDEIPFSGSDLEESDVVHLNPPRDVIVPPESLVVVLSSLKHAP